MASKMVRTHSWLRKFILLAEKKNANYISILLLFIRFVCMSVFVIERNLIIIWWGKNVRANIGTMNSFLADIINGNRHNFGSDAIWSLLLVVWHASRGQFQLNSIETECRACLNNKRKFRQPKRMWFQRSIAQTIECIWLDFDAEEMIEIHCCDIAQR